MPRGRKLVPVELRQEERDVLEGWARRRTTAQGLATRSRIVLLAAKGWTNSIVAAHLHVTRLTVGKWRSRFLELGGIRPSRLLGRRRLYRLLRHLKCGV